MVVDIIMASKQFSSLSPPRHPSPVTLHVVDNSAENFFRFLETFSVLLCRSVFVILRWSGVFGGCVLGRVVSDVPYFERQRSLWGGHHRVRMSDLFGLSLASSARPAPQERGCNVDACVVIIITVRRGEHEHDRFRCSYHYYQEVISRSSRSSNMDLNLT